MFSIIEPREKYFSYQGNLQRWEKKIALISLEKNLLIKRYFITLSKEIIEYFTSNFLFFLKER
jgi:hypothetical protein